MTATTTPANAGFGTPPYPAEAIHRRPPETQTALRTRPGRRVLPGLPLSLGVSLTYLSIVVLLPLVALFARTFSLTFDAFIDAVFAPRVVATYLVSFGAALLAAVTNVVFGGILAWVLVRYSFPGRKLVDTLIDLPFALPTAVAGIALTAIYAKNGVLGAPLEALGLKVAFTPIGIYVAMVFIGLPFVVRTLQPVLQDHEIEFEEAAASLGASRLRTIIRVILPAMIPALLTGFALAFARAVGEYGSIIFIAGNVPYVSEITPLIIITKLEQYDYAGATAVASVMLVISFVLLLAINLLQAWTARRSGRTL